MLKMRGQMIEMVKIWIQRHEITVADKIGYEQAYLSRELSLNIMFKGLEMKL